MSEDQYVSLDAFKDKYSAQHARYEASKLPEAFHLRDFWARVPDGPVNAFVTWCRWMWTDLQTAWSMPTHWFQRAKRGYSNHDAWSFFTHEARMISQVCQYYLDADWSHPCGIKRTAAFEEYFNGNAYEMSSPCEGCGCSAEWTRILTTMRDGFTRITEEDEYGPNGMYLENFEFHPQVTEALDLYRKHFFSMWL